MYKYNVYDNNSTKDGKEEMEVYSYKIHCPWSSIILFDIRLLYVEGPYSKP